MKSQLVNRWKTESGVLLAQQIRKTLMAGEPLEKIDGIEKNGYRLDLRGITLSELEDEQTIKAGEHQAIFKAGILKLKNNVFDAIDFSFSTISYAQIQKCKFSNCVFESVIAKELEISASDFIDCVFKKVNFYCSFMNKNIGSNSGSYVNCTFDEANLTETSFRFPTIKNCVFKNCKLSATNFDGSRFDNCKFIGKVDSPLFKGYSVYAVKSILWIFNRIDPKMYPNKMLNVDFSEAEMKGVSFSHGIDLTTCIFPKGDQYIFIKNLNGTMTNVRETIATEWEDDEQERGLRLIDNLFYDKRKQDQQMDFIDTLFTGNYDPEFDKIFFDLIKNNLRD
ncbi:pentapeptide repeat-containing protein [Mucilaginibacter mali]|uniref:Pentapeptide repeat-containing protein n=1 Tax=Mucilaginibacter mali TaxID=2740462 RepID=A0A7D4UKW6_9SPHI|nr:pentapeptide repeat-containing protein [Mucilaginibacter mali]QKJ29001.1 pentapeptide repeat-containing protein [Mucilaginibacter mali]